MFFFILLKIGFLPLYTKFVQNYDAASMKIVELTKNSKFDAFLTKCKENPENKKNLTLESFLIQPVQRTMRYELLLRELLKHTWPDHPDYEGLKQAVEKVHQMAELLNLRKREGENNMELVNIDQNMSGKPKDLEIIIPSRKFIAKWVVKAKGGTITIIVCSDILIVARGDEKLKFIDYALVNECEILPLTNPKKKSGGSDSWEFEIRKWGIKKPIAVAYAESESERAKIIEAVGDAGEKKKESTRLHKRQIRKSSEGSKMPQLPPPPPTGLAAAVESGGSDSMSYSSVAEDEDDEKLISLTPEKQLLERRKKQEA